MVDLGLISVELEGVDKVKDACAIKKRCVRRTGCRHGDTHIESDGRLDEKVGGGTWWCHVEGAA